MKDVMTETIAYIKHLAQDLAGCSPECAVVAILLDMAVPVHYDGFEYLKTAIVLQQEVPARDLVNDIYRMVAVQYGVNPEMVAAAIRSAVSAGWWRAERQIWHLYLPTIPRCRSKAPTNAEVIAGLARILELWQGCAQAYLRQQLKEVVSSGKK